MLNWYEFEPADTLFFRGAEPMEMGEDHSATPIFPPMPQTIAGALRTTILIQNGVDFKDYEKGNIDDDLKKSVGEYGKKAPFEVVGPLFSKDNKLYIPAPYSWYMDKSRKFEIEKSPTKSVIVKVKKSKKIEEDFIKTKNKPLYWVKPNNEELVSLGGFWIKFDDINKNELEVYSLEYFVVFEQRVGIGLNDKADKGRIVREGMIYAFNHARLKESVKIAFGIDKELPLREEGILRLGAERRFGRYTKTKIDLPNDESNSDGEWISLSVVPKSEKANEHIIATGKIMYVGGWDLAKGFHKPMVGYFPAGSVFNTKINKNFIKIK